jgi:hypothetical protein
METIEVMAMIERYYSEALIEAFTGGDQDIRDSLERMYREEGAAGASGGMVKPELAEYLNRARAAG